MSEPLVSVVVPVYNGAKIVRTAIESILNQTLKNLEIIAVNDGSLDETSVVLEELARADARVIIVHQENQGSYNARTNGIEIARGRYFTSVDADDTIEPTMLDRMVSLAEREGLDLVECDLSVDTDRSGRIEIYKGRHDTRKNYIEPALICGIGFMCVCGKLYRREVVFDDVRKKHILKQRVTLFDDMLFNFQVLDRISSYGRIREPLYNYYINEGSSVRNFKQTNIECLETIVNARDEFAHRYGISPQDERMIFWALKNTKNTLVLAAYSQQKSLQDNVRYINDILRLESFKTRWRRVDKCQLPLSYFAFFVFAIYSPAVFFVVTIKVLKWVQNSIHRIGKMCKHY